MNIDINVTSLGEVMIVSSKPFAAKCRICGTPIIVEENEIGNYKFKSTQLPCNRGNHKFEVVFQ